MRRSFDSKQQTRALYLTAGLVSLLLSVWIALHQVIINPDAICYLLSANEVGQSGIRAAMHLCGQASWPFYSALIFFFSKYTFLSLTTSAYVLDTLFTLISVLSFMTIVQMLGGTRRVLWLAAFVILCSYQFNSVRQYIVRDHGFWAFYLVSMIFMLRFLRENHLKNALGFSASLILAALFRIEGAVFLVTLPFLVFLNTGDWQSRFFSFLKLNIAAIAAVLGVGIWVLAHPHDHLDTLGRVPELLNQFVHGFTIVVERFQAAKPALIAHVLPSEAARDAGQVWAMVLIGLYFANIMNNVSWVALALVIYGWMTGITAKFSRGSQLVLWGYLAVNVGITTVFLAQRMFFSKRYLIALSLVLMLWVPFVLDKLLSERASSRQRFAAYLAMVIFFVSSLGVAFDTGASRNYVRDAGSWLAANVPAEAKLYSNDVQLAYYSEHYGSDIYAAMRLHRDVEATLLPRQLAQYDYAALRVRNDKDKKLAAFMSDMHVPMVKDFVNQHGDHVMIYKMPQQAAQ